MKEKPEAGSVTWTARGEVFGVPVDVDFKETVDKEAGTVTMEVSMVMPHFEYNAEHNIMHVFPPPLREPPVTEREERLLRLMGWS